MYQINDDVLYTYIKSGTIDNIHYDDAPDLYYTVKLTNVNRYPQTTSKNLFLLEKVGTKEPFDKGDEVIYIKRINTKIYNIDNTNKENPLYKIKFNNIEKYVNGKRLKKLYK